MKRVALLYYQVSHIGFSLSFFYFWSHVPSRSCLPSRTVTQRNGTKRSGRFAPELENQLAFIYMHHGWVFANPGELGTNPDVKHPETPKPDTRRKHTCRIYVPYTLSTRWSSLSGPATKGHTGRRVRRRAAAPKTPPRRR